MNYGKAVAPNSSPNRYRSTARCAATSAIRMATLSKSDRARTSFTANARPFVEQRSDLSMRSLRDPAGVYPAGLLIFETGEVWDAMLEADRSDSALQRMGNLDCFVAYDHDNSHARRFSSATLLLLSSERELAKLLCHLVTCLDLLLSELSRFFRQVQNQRLKLGYCFLRSSRFLSSSRSRLRVASS